MLLSYDDDNADVMVSTVTTNSKKRLIEFAIILHFIGGDIGFEGVR